MYTSIFRACLLLIGFVFSLSVHAAGLGKLTVNSSLGQPLNAEIDLVSVNEEELSTLKADFASREAFAQAGIRYEPFYASFKISIESRINGVPYVRIISPQAVNEPFLNMLVELSWASGRLLREYTVLLDPADARVPVPVAPSVPAIQENLETTAEIETAPLDQDISQSSTISSPKENIVQTPQPAPQTSVQTPGTYGPILEGDTLSSIARQVKPEAVNINQMLVALFRANREAFIADNMNLLRTGVILKIPDLQELAKISEREANIEVRVQVNDWHKYRQNLALSTQQPQDTDSLSQTAAGQITTAVDNAAVTRNEPPEEVLRLSSGERLLDSQDAYSDLSTQERVRMMEEDAIARNLALKEANERVAMLEKNIENLQKLLALQNPELAQAQINAQAQEEQPQTEIESIEVIPSESTLTTETEFDIAKENNPVIGFDVISEPDAISVATTNAGETIEIGSIETVAPVASVASVTNPVLIPESEEASFLDQMMGNMNYIGAALAILLLALFAVIYRRRRKVAEEEAEAEESRYEELSSALRNKTAAVVAAAYATNNRNDEAEEFDQTNQFFTEENAQEKEGVKTSFGSEQPIELDFSKENEKAENESDALLDELEMDAFDEGQSEIEKHNDSSQEKTEDDFDFDADFEAKKPSTNERGADERPEIDEEQPLEFPQEESNSTDNALDYELKIEFDETKEAEESDGLKVDLADQEPEAQLMQGSEAVSNPDNTLDFSVDSSTFDLSDEVNKVEEQKPAQQSFEDETNILSMPEANTESDANMNFLQIQANNSHQKLIFQILIWILKKKIHLKQRRIR